MLLSLIPVRILHGHIELLASSAGRPRRAAAAPPEPHLG
jgi:hypothetical protein